MTQIREEDLLARLRTLASAEAQREASPHVRVEVMKAWDARQERRTRFFGWRAAFVTMATVIGIALVGVSFWRQTDWLAIVEAADGSHYGLGPNTVFSPDDSRGAMLTLKDGSRVEMRAHSALSLERASDGIGIRLRTGGLVINAVPQDRSHLYVHTKDMTVVVLGTFAVNTEDNGSRVAVIDGEVRVREGTSEKKLTRGEQVATSPLLATRPVKEEFTWSRQANVIAAAFAQGMANTAAPLAAVAAPQTRVQGLAPTEPEFEVASIRACDPDHLPETPGGGRGGGANSLQMTPGRLRALCMTAATLIRTAYGFGPIDLEFLNGGSRGRAMDFTNVYGLGVEDGRRVRSGPDWMRSEHYTIEAVAVPGQTPSAETMRGPMLQRLLERRLQLKAHVEVEQIPSFALAVSKSGLKIKPVTADACEPTGPPLPNGAPSGGRRHLDDVRRGERPSCGLLGERNGPNTVFIGGAVPLEGLTRVLGSRLGGIRVLDRTGTTDRFNFVLEFAVDENAPGLPIERRLDLPPLPGAENDAPLAPTIFTALEDQLGLRLERAQAGREFLVVDHIERPTSN